MSCLADGSDRVLALLDSVIQLTYLGPWTNTWDNRPTFFRRVSKPARTRDLNVVTTSTDQRQHAVVIGASLGGLMAAGAASRHFNRVTVLERDQLPNEPIVRKGVPHGTQIHVILPIGPDYMEQVFPDIRKDFEAHGCPAYD